MKHSITLINLVVPEKGEPIVTPLGPLYIANALEETGIDVDFKDYQLSREDLPYEPDSMVRFCSTASSEIIAIGCYEQLLPYAVLVAKHIKEKDKNKIIILGGYGPTGKAYELLKTFPFIDIIVIGEGEETMKELINSLSVKSCKADFSGLQSVKGIGYRVNGEVKINEPRPLISNLDTIPRPKYNKINLENYSAISVSTLRGCPYRCSFCGYSSFWNYKIRMRSVQSIVSEIEEIYLKYNKKAITITDGTFLSNKARAKEFCSELKKRKINISWDIFANVHEIDENIIAECSALGCRSVYLGIESGSNKILKEIGKPCSSEDAIKVVKIISKYMDVWCSFIWGFPNETLKDYYETVMQMRILHSISNRVHIKLNYLIPLAQSSLYKTHKELISSEMRPEIIQGSGVFPPGKVPLEVKKLVEKHRDIFPSYFYFKTPDIEKKIELTKRTISGVIEE